MSEKTDTTELLPCPFCGETPDIANPATFQDSQGTKWGAVVCCCTGPEVRTGYGPVEDWRDDAIEAWNTRAGLNAECDKVLALAIEKVRSFERDWDSPTPWRDQLIASFAHTPSSEQATS